MNHATLRVGLAVLGLVIGAAAPAWAGLVFTDQSAFLASIQPGYYLEDFNGLPSYTFLGSPVTFSGNGFSYDASSDDSVYSTSAVAGDIALSTLFSGTPLTITFTGAPVTAVGGNIFASDIDGNYTPGAITLLLDNGESITIPDPIRTSFAGFITSSPIVSLSILPENFNINYWPTLDNLIVGQAALSVVPEPSTLLTAGTAVLVSFACARRRRQRAESSAA